MRNPTRKQLLATTVVPVAPTPDAPSNKDNAPPVEMQLPTREQVHASIETTLATIVNNEQAIEYARQFLAHLLDERHTQLEAAVPTDAPADKIVPVAYALAINDVARSAYLNGLVAEFTVADEATLKTQTNEQRKAYVKRMTERLRLALELFANIAWFRHQNPNAVCRWNADLGRWELAPGAFIPPGYAAGASLLKEKDGVTDVQSIVLESDESDKWYFVSRGRGPGITVNVSLSQFNHTVKEMIQAMRNPAQDPNGVQATPARGRRARTPVAPTPTDAPTLVTGAADAAVAKEDSDVPEATAPEMQGDRAWALGQLFKLLAGVERILEHDTLANLSWSDLTKDAVNSVTAIQMCIDRMNAKPDGKPVQPGKPDARKAA